MFNAGDIVESKDEHVVLDGPTGAMVIHQGQVCKVGKNQEGSALLLESEYGTLFSDYSDLYQHTDKQYVKKEPRYPW
jgi:hypothetical protein